MSLLQNLTPQAGCGVGKGKYKTQVSTCILFPLLVIFPPTCRTREHEVCSPSLWSNKAWDQGITAGRRLFPTGEIYELSTHLNSSYDKAEAEKNLENLLREQSDLQSLFYVAGSIPLWMSKLNMNIQLFFCNCPILPQNRWLPWASKGDHNLLKRKEILFTPQKVYESSF